MRRPLRAAAAPPHRVVGDCAWSVALPDGSGRVVQSGGGYRVVEWQDSIFQIAIYALPAPPGPFGAGVVLPASAEPEAGQPAQPQQGCSPCATGTLIACNAKEHPELESGGALVLSRDVNSTVASDALLAPANYRPRFIDVTLS